MSLSTKKLTSFLASPNIPSVLSLSFYEAKQISPKLACCPQYHLTILFQEIRLIHHPSYHRLLHV